MAWHKTSENWLVTDKTGGRLKQSLILNRWSMHTYDIIHGDMQHCYCKCVCVHIWYFSMCNGAWNNSKIKRC